MNIAEQAYRALYPDKEPEILFEVKYHGKFSPYNANVRYTRTRMTFNLSKEWRHVSKEIKIGLIQSLIFKIKKEKRTTMNIDLYNLFLKNVHKAAPKINIDPMLEKRFDIINDKYFFGMMDIPNLRFGEKSTRTLGHYHYGSDTIIISSMLKKAPLELLDYVLYHELLHKKHKFSHKNNRSFHHTKDFKKDEKKFENAEILEKELKKFLAKKRVKRWFWF